MNIHRLSIMISAALMLSSRTVAATNTIAVGQTALGTFTDSSQIAYFTFDGVSNDIVRVSLTHRGVYSSLLRVLGPNGEHLASDSPPPLSPLRENVLRNVRLPRDGTYLVECSVFFVSGSDDYALSVLQVPGVTTAELHEDGPLVAGRTRFCELTAGDVDAFQYFAESNEVINVVAARLAGNTVTGIEVYGPDGTFLTSQIGRVIVRLQEEGMHWIVCYGGFGTNHYGLNLVRTPGTNEEEPNEGGALLPGIQRHGSFEAADIDVYEYSGNVGETITLLLARTNWTGAAAGRALWLHSPDGEVLATGSGGDQVNVVPKKLPVTGSFFVVVAGSARGGYSLTVVRNPGANQNEPGEGGLLEAGQERSGFLSPGDIDIYEIQGHCGETVTLQMGTQTAPSGFFGPLLELHRPDGGIVAATPLRTFTANAAAFIAGYRVSETGTYLVLCRAADGVTTNNYRLTLIRNPGPNPHEAYAGALIPGQTRSAVLGFADVDVYTFWGRYNDQISLSMNEAAPDNVFAPHLQIHAPNGTIIADVQDPSTAAVTDFTLPMSGEYLVVCMPDLEIFARDSRYLLDLQIVSAGYDAPSLSAARCDNDILLRWPSNYASYRLECAPTLPAVRWDPIAPPYDLLGNQTAVRIPQQLQSRFFRLQRE